MDYSGFNEFPFPSNLSDEGKKIRDYFFHLSDSDQLVLLNASRSYEGFYQLVAKRMSENKKAAAR